MMKAIFYTAQAGNINGIYTDVQRRIIRSLMELTDDIYTKEQILSAPERF